MEKKVLNTKEAAEYLRVISPQTLEKWRSRCHGRGPAWVKLGKRVGYRPEDLDRFLEERTKKFGERFTV